MAIILMDFSPDKMLLIKIKHLFVVGMLLVLSVPVNWCYAESGSHEYSGYTPSSIISSETTHNNNSNVISGQEKIIMNQNSFIIILLVILIVVFLLKLLKVKDNIYKENNELQSKIIEDKKLIKENLHALQLEKERVKRFATIMEQSHDAIMVTDVSGKIEFINPKFTEFTGYKDFEIIGKNSRIVQPEWISLDKRNEFMKITESNKAWRSEVEYYNKEGKSYWAFESISSIKDEKGKVIHYLSTHRDISQEHKLNEQLNFQATHDELTRLVNRREFERRVENLLSANQVEQGQHALCFMDLDQFKIVNDTCGHDAGDHLLRQISAVLLDTIRKRDTLARLGGDEFGILFEHCSIDDAYRVTASILNSVQNFQFSWDGRSFKLGVSIGLVAISESTTLMTDILKAADSACYMAKDAGRNRIHIYHADDLDVLQRQGEMQWVSKINQALDDNLFCLYAQPIVSIDGNKARHYELLVRMIDESGENVPPGAFLPAAERYNLISKLDRWVIKNAFELLSNNDEFRKHFNYCSINLSGQSLTESSFLDFVIDELTKSNIRNEKICFEITETAAITNMNLAIKFISTIKRLGCKFALDDFGSGLSSFAYLKNLPVDYLKIDGMFVRDIADDPIDHAMVKSINEIGHIMGMKTIAEFVENDVIKDMLTDIGVNYAQGYGIGKPVSLLEVLGENNSELRSQVESTSNVVQMKLKANS
jgi:diguanylate cyclase (GGDEF)-like protein/PAS domain S-box-containing protein